MVDNIEFNNPLPNARRLAWRSARQPSGRATIAGLDERLGPAIERLRTLGATAVVLDAAAIGADGRIEATWFSRRQLPMRADILSRVSWQIQSRAESSSICGCRAARRSPRSAIPRKSARYTTTSARRYPPVACSSMTRPSWPSFPEEIPGRRGKCARRATPRPAITCRPRRRSHCRRSRPWSITGRGCASHLSAPIAPPTSPAASPTLRFHCRSRRTRVPSARSATAVARARLAGAGICTKRGGLWFVGPKSPQERDLIDATRLFQRRGGTAIGWATDDPTHDRPNAKIVEPTISSATFPERF